MIANDTIWEKSTLTHRQCSKCILGRKKQTVEHYWSWTAVQPLQSLDRNISEAV